MTTEINVIPSEGEVWASPCRFIERKVNIGNGAMGLRAGVRRSEAGVPLWDIEGYETREVLAVVELPRRQRHVVYVRRYAPDGRAPFGSTKASVMSLNAFNKWRKGTLRRGMKPAIMVQPSVVDRALKILEAA